MTPVPINAAAEPAAERPPNKRQQAKANTRQRIIDAARTAFAAVGFFDATIRDIALQAGMSTGAVFATVPDKEALWRLAMGGPPPSLELANQVARLEAERPDWAWLLRKERGRYVVTLTPPGWAPTLRTPDLCMGRGDSPATALWEARQQANQREPLPCA